MKQQVDPATTLLAATSEPEPSASLRARTLARAGEAWAQPVAPDPWRRAWESRPLRLAWATVSVALVLANLALPSRLSSPARGAHTSAVAQDEARRELREVVSLPRLKMEYAAMDIAVRPSLPSDRQHLVSHPVDKENRS
jgi:hypothetical protein